jgi:hypothetical protein
MEITDAPYDVDKAIRERLRELAEKPGRAAKTAVT